MLLLSATFQMIFLLTMILVAEEILAVKEEGRGHRHIRTMRKSLKQIFIIQQVACSVETKKQYPPGKT